MARSHDSMINPPIENLLDRVDSKFSLVTLAAKRARQVNSYFNHLGEGVNNVPPQVATVARKPLSIAFEEIAVDKIVRRPIVPGETTDETSGEAGAEGAEVASAEAASGDVTA